MEQLYKIELAGAVLYPQLRRLRKEGHNELIALSERQTDLLEALALCAGSLVTNRMLVAVLYGRRSRRVRRVTLVALVCRLKGRLANVSEGIQIFCVQNQGYMLVNA
jgi:DNA-binding winged helix-turn-helix (wHTH) protein